MVARRKVRPRAALLGMARVIPVVHNHGGWWSVIFCNPLAGRTLGDIAAAALTNWQLSFHQQVRSYEDLLELVKHITIEPPYDSDALGHRDSWTVSLWEGNSLELLAEWKCSKADVWQVAHTLADAILAGYVVASVVPGGAVPLTATPTVRAERHPRRSALSLCEV